jgi:hypothetical protein
MHVRGTIRSNKSGNLLIQVPGVTVKGKLAADPKIQVALHNPAWAQPGDAVLVDGVEIAPAQGDQPQRIAGYVVNIKLEKPLEGKKKIVPMRKKPTK